MAILRRPPLPLGRPSPEGSLLDMLLLDFLLLGLGAGFFALMAAYVAGCERV
jgi:hypothetical protein